MLIDFCRLSNIGNRLNIHVYNPFDGNAQQIQLQNTTWISTFRTCHSHIRLSHSRHKHFQYKCKLSETLLIHFHRNGFMCYVSRADGHTSDDPKLVAITNPYQNLLRSFWAECSRAVRRASYIRSGWVQINNSVDNFARHSMFDAFWVSHHPLHHIKKSKFATWSSKCSGAKLYLGT